MMNLNFLLHAFLFLMANYCLFEAVIGKKMKEGDHDCN